MNIDPKNIFTVHIMPCSAKKSEIEFECDALKDKKIKDTDVVITVRELARILKQKGIDLKKLPDSKFDDPIGQSSGAGVIFGASGGVMEAALRTVNDVLTKNDIQKIDYKQVRGNKGIKEATLNINGNKINVCVASGLSNAKIVLDNVKNGKKKYHFIEIMCCPSGCVNGGGMPYIDYDEIDKQTVIKLRAKALYKNDLKKPIRKSHQNPSIIKIYKEYFNQPNSQKAHHILHRSYKNRNFI